MAINTKMMKLWETTVTFFSCACAYILGLPMATEVNIIIYFYLFIQCIYETFQIKNIDLK